MQNRIGLIQTGGISDIVIALPIADFYAEQGFEVLWPIDERFIAFFREAKPEVNFIPIPPDASPATDQRRYLYDEPMARLQQANCQRIIPLYSEVGGLQIADPMLARSLKFDELKYAVAGVPFGRKWRLRLNRNPARENSLHQRLSLTRPYICVHTTSATCSLNMAPSPEWQEKFQIVEIRELTDNPFDWISTLERAAKVLLLDSLFANLVEQLNMRIQKAIILRSDVRQTPVLLNGWEFLPLPQSPDGRPQP
jgi:hypothetical protein